VQIHDSGDLKQLDPRSAGIQQFIEAHNIQQIAQDLIQQSAFGVTMPKFWNSLPDNLRNITCKATKID